MRIFSTTILAFFLIGCSASQFQIIEVNKFDDSFEPTIEYAAIGNVLSHFATTAATNGHKMYLNPVLMKDKDTGAVLLLLYFENVIDYPDKGFQPLYKIIFRTSEDEQIALRFTRPERWFAQGYRHLAIHTEGYCEKAVAYIDTEDFHKLCEASWLEAKIVGKKRDIILAKNDIADSFIENLSQFAELLE